MPVPDLSQYEIEVGDTVDLVTKINAALAAIQSFLGSMGISILGTVADVASLPGSATVGDAYMVEEFTPSRLYVYDSTNSWVDLGQLQGEDGATGDPGTGITPQAVGWTGTGGTTPRTLTVDVSFTTSEGVTLTGTQTLSNKTLVAPALGTPAGGTLTNCTGLPISTGVTGLAANIATFLATPSSANLRAAVTDESGSGALLFAGGALGTPASGTLTNCTKDGTNGIGYLNIPQNSQSAAYTAVLADAGKHIFHPAADTTARTFTIPANASVAYPIGTALTFVNENGAGVVTIAITSDTMRLAGAGTTGSRTLAANGIATAIKVTSTSWIISGTGLT